MLIRLSLWMILMMTSASPQADAQQAKPSSYRGWKTLELTNGLVEVQVVPEIGGRVIQLKLGDFEYFWVNDRLAGKLPPPGRLGPDGAWLNYGGEKLWPAPQGWSGEHEWPGPPDPVLDGGPHAGSIVTGRGNPVSVRLVSPKDARTGIQFSRLIQVYDGWSRVHVDATMTNVDSRPRRWGIWSVVQHNAANRSGPGPDKNLRVWCPINPASLHPGGFKVMFGEPDNPSFQPEQDWGLLRVHYQRRVGKVGLDSPAGWVATVHGSRGHAFVQRFPYFHGKKYPDDATVEVWLHGVGRYFAAGKWNELRDDPIECPYFVETEVLSPFAALAPGESYTFSQDWHAVAVGGDYPVLDCTSVGITCEPLVATRSDGNLILNGRFGIFCQGTLALIFADAAGRPLARTTDKRPIGPTEPLVLKDLNIPAVPPQAVQVKLVVLDPAGHVVGDLARAAIR